MGFGVTLLFAFISLGVSLYFFTSVDQSLIGDIEVISNQQTVEQHIKKFEDVLGADYEAYKGHVYRVLTYSIHFLHGDKSAIDAIAVALVYHDIGLWSDNALAYLEPSIKRAVEDNSAAFAPDQIQLISDIINYHHKVTPFEGPSADVVNAVRKADWIDATRGLVHHKMPCSHIKTVAASIPYAGFHQILLNFVPRVRGWNVLKGIWELCHILKL